MATHHSAVEIATLFNLTDCRIRQLAREGIIPQPKDGKFDLVKCVKGYVKYLQSNKFKTRGDDLHAKELKERLLEAQVIRAEAEARKELDKYVRVDQVEAELSNMQISVRNRILAVPHRIGVILGERFTQEDTSVIRDLLCEALTDLSTYEPSTEEE